MGSHPPSPRALDGSRRSDSSIFHQSKVTTSARKAKNIARPPVIIHSGFTLRESDVVGAWSSLAAAAMPRSDERVTATDLIGC
jgi:hypothetical protein